MQIKGCKNDVDLDVAGMQIQQENIHLSQYTVFVFYWDRWVAQWWKMDGWGEHRVSLHGAETYNPLKRSITVVE